MNSMSIENVTAQRLLDLSSVLPPQERTVLKHLVTEGHLTNAAAHTVYRIRSVSRRVSSIRNFLGYLRCGWAIETSRHLDGAGQKYVRYHLVNRASV